LDLDPTDHREEEGSLPRGLGFRRGIRRGHVGSRRRRRSGDLWRWGEGERGSARRGGLEGEDGVFDRFLGWGKDVAGGSSSGDELRAWTNTSVLCKVGQVEGIIGCAGAKGRQ
jgi:hypothetical protein